MADKLSLRDYQRDLAERLRVAGGARSASLLALQVGTEGWLVDLGDAGEVIPVPRITAVPLTRPWFRGMANIRGNLYGVIDFAAFLGIGVVAVTEEARLLLLGARYRVAAALLVDRSLGLRNPEQLKPADPRESAWTSAVYADADGRAWKRLDVAGLVQHNDFLNVSAQ